MLVLSKKASAGQAGAQSQADSTSPQAARASSPVRARSPMQAPPPRSSRHSPSQGDENAMEDPKLKWVINLSSKPLTQAQRSLLVKGPNFAVTPKHLPNLEYITAIESICSKLDQQDAEELRANINRVLRSSHPLNLT